MTPARQEILRVLEALSSVYPDMRFGQLVLNISNWATRVPEGVWDVEDEEFLDAAKKHLDKRTRSQSASEPIAP